MSSTVSALTASRLTPYGISGRLVGLALPACLARSTDAIDSTNAIEAPRYKRNERNQRNRPNSLASLAFPARRASLADPIDSTDSTRLTGLDYSTDDEVDPLRKPRRLQKARELTKEVYRLTADHQFSRDFGLRNQMRRAAVSIMANIAEGFSRRSDKEFSQFLFIAKSSAAELQSHAYVSLDQGYVTEPDFQTAYTDAEHESRMLSNLIKHLDGRSQSTQSTQ